MTNIVIIADEALCCAVRARTVKTINTDQRWSSEALQSISATVKTPVPNQGAFSKLAAGEPPVVNADVNGDATTVPEDDHTLEDTTVKDLTVTRQVLRTCGYSDWCPGCDAVIQGRDTRRP